MKHAVSVLLLVAWGLASAAGPGLSFADAKKIWERTKGRKDYQTYAGEFAQFNNHFRLDEKDGCYALGKDPVELMLVIAHQGKEQYAVIEQVLTSVDNAKARCFRKSYGGVRTKIPPFFPFVLQMGMG